MPARNLVSELIATVSDGDFDARATRELTRAVEAVEAGNGNATITITLKLKKDDRKITLTPGVKATIPVAAVSAAHFFVDAASRLTDEDPRQARLPFKDVSRPKPNVVDLDAKRKAAGERSPDTEPPTTTNDSDSKNGKGN